MPNINILEIDNTSGNTVLQGTDVVYIPGFVDLSDDNFDDVATKAAVNEPKLCLTKTQFESYFGKHPAQFASNQSYPAAFSSNSKPTGNFLAENSYDPSYIMAKELIALGLPVLYERVNAINADGFILTTEKPSNWSIAYTSYFTRSGVDPNYTYVIVAGSYTAVTGDTAPKYEANKYYLRIGASPTYTYVLLENDEAPSNWATTYTSYYTMPEPDWAADTYYQHDFGVTVANMYTALENVYTKLSDKGEYTIKYLTSGGYPVYDYNSNAIVTKMLSLAATRGDCVAIIDHTNYKSRSLDPANPASVYYSIKNSTVFSANGQFGVMFTPWAQYNRVSTDTFADSTVISSAELPASFAYLASLAKSIKTNANWLAIAGVTRGVVPNLNANSDNNYYPLLVNPPLTNSIAESYQPRTSYSINSITNISGYGFCVWGNRTLKLNSDGLTATSFLNIRNLVSDVKKIAYSTAKRLAFEQDSNILWINFKAGITNTLDKMKSGFGLSGYKIIRVAANEKAKLIATIKLYPLYAVEDFELTVVMEDNEVTIE